MLVDALAHLAIGLEHSTVAMKLRRMTDEFDVISIIGAKGIELSGP